MSLVAAALIGVGGLAIGASGIGGIVVVPVLTALGGVAPARAVAAASLGFGFAGVAAMLQGRRRRDTVVSDSDPSATCAAQPVFGVAALGAAAVGAAIGALTLAWLPAQAITLVVGALALVSGLATLLGRQEPRLKKMPAQVVTGLALIVGLASAWSGTGGPVVLLPLLAWLGWPPGIALDAAQRVQLPVAIAATLVNALASRLDVLLGAAVGVLVLAGWFAGRRLARRLPAQRLRQLVAVALVATGLATLTSVMS